MLHALRETQRRQGAKTQGSRGCAVAEGNDGGGTVRPLWRVIYSDPQHSAMKLNRSDSPTSPTFNHAVAPGFQQHPCISSVSAERCVRPGSSGRFFETVI